MAKKSLHNSEMIDSADNFETVYKANAPLIYRFMFWRTKDRMLAEDLTSNVFEKAWRTRTSFQGGSVKAWLYKIARNTLIDYWRKKKDISVENVGDLETVESDTEHGTTFDQVLLADSLQAAVAKLPAEMRSVVRLRFIEGLSARQAGAQLGISESNVRVIQYRALRRLKGYIK